jgi:hypothetical protein
MSKLISKECKISDKLSFHFLSIRDYDDNFKKLIDENISSICNGILGDNDIDIIKIELKRWFDGKDNSKKSGFVAEFFCHLYMKQLNFEQHFLFRNLEETNSMKKGFDGVYVFQDEMWLYESKSSLSTTLDATHNSNIGEAFRDINKKLNGTKLDIKKNPIDPWTNAINHASLQQVNPNKTLIVNLNEFKKKFFKNDYEDIKNFNVIPSSTIYLESNWIEILQSDLEKKLNKLTKNYNYKKMMIVCVNKKSFNDFIKYIDGK